MVEVLFVLGIVVLLVLFVFWSIVVNCFGVIGMSFVFGDLISGCIFGIMLVWRICWMCVVIGYGSCMCIGEYVMRLLFMIVICVWGNSVMSVWVGVI